MNFVQETLAEEASGYDEAFLAHVDHLAEWSRSARNLMRRSPASVNWLASNHQHLLSPTRLRAYWQKDFAAGLAADANAISEPLRRFRKWMSLRIAFREVNGLASVQDGLLELSQLADYCLETIFNAVRMDLERNLGIPWDDAQDQPARCCMLGMGKLGGMELNYWSDVDLIFLYDGEGFCRKGERATSTVTREFFTKLVRMMAAFAQERTPEGVLYNVDLRLRPEGESGPVIKNLQAMVSYYFEVGQTWERLALARARPVAGDAALGGEFLEEIHSFAHPRHPPPTLIKELASARYRFSDDRHDPGDRRNVKTGYGGIREIEFFVQALQLLNTGQQPFLQARPTLDTLDRLGQYEILQPGELEELRLAYLFLRMVENRLQMEEDLPVHELPEDPERQEALAESMGHADWAGLLGVLNHHRKTVRAVYETLFGRESQQDVFDSWFDFFSGTPAAGVPQRQIRDWFGSRDDIEEQLRIFVLGGHSHFLTREHVRLFTGLSEHFPTVLPRLAFPMQALQKLGKFGEHYGSRKGLFKTCALTPQLFEMLCLLFDRSPFIHEHLCRHPEILDELLTQPVHLLKLTEKTLQELQELPDDKDFPRWLWLYVRAEQIRASMGEHLGYFDTPVIEKNLSLLADSVLQHLLHKSGVEDRLGIVALGKYGAEEMTIGSDLDLLIVATAKPDSALKQAARKLVQDTSWQGSLSQTFEVDTRLRPYGEDGPLVVTLESLARYHAEQAKLWERQCLTRARFVAGNPELGQQFDRLREKLLFSQNFGKKEVRAILQMREKIRQEKSIGPSPWRAFKACRGGLSEIEFFVQILQMYHGRTVSELRPLTNTRELFRLLPKFKCIDKEGCARILLNYNFLRKLEFFLRRFHGKPATSLNTKPEENTIVTHWFQAESHENFIAEHRHRLDQSWQEIQQVLKNTFDLDIR